MYLHLFHQPDTMHISTYSFSLSLTVSKLSNIPLFKTQKNRGRNTPTLFQARTYMTFPPRGTLIKKFSHMLHHASCYVLNAQCISQLRSIFCDSSTWFNIKLDTTSPVPSSSINVILPPFSNLLSISTASMPRAKQHMR